MIEVLKSCFLFNSLQKETLHDLLKITFISKYKKNEILFYEGDAPKYLHILLDGNVKVYKTDKDGNRTVLHSFYSQSIIGEMANFHSIPFPATAVCDEDGLVLKIHYSEFEKFFLVNPLVSLEFIKSLTKKIKALENFIFSNVMLDATGKVAEFLLENEKVYYKKSEIADHLNITPVHLSRILSKFRGCQIIKDTNKEISIIDKQALQNLCRI